MWCNACRAVGMIHCAHPSECGNMLSDSAAADNWKAWLDDLPLGAEFQPAVDRLQDFISGLARPRPTPDPAAIREAAARTLLDMLYMRNGAQNGMTRNDVQRIWDAASTREGYAAVEAFLLALIQKGAAE